MQNLELLNFEVQAGDVGFTSASGRGFNLTVNSLHGAGNLYFANAGTYNLDIQDTTGYSGNFSLLGDDVNAGTTLGLLADLNFLGALSIQTGSFVNLTHSVTVGGLEIGGTALGAGSYDYNYLSSNFGDIFTEGSVETGVINVVPEPSSFALLIGGLVLGLTFVSRRRS